MKKGIIALLLLLALWACQDLNPVQPSKELDLNHLYGTYIDTVFNATQETFKTDDRVNSGSGLRLNVGRYQGFESGFLLKFVTLPTAETHLDSAYIELTSLGKFGSGADSMTIAVYRVQEDWEEQKANTQDEWHVYLKQPPEADRVGSYTFPAADTLTMRFPLDSALVNEWRRDPDSNKGLFFKPENTNPNYIREIEALETGVPANWPKFCYFTKPDTEVIKDSIQTGLDVSIFNYEGDLFSKAQQQKKLLVASGIAARTFVRFAALDSLPKTAIIQEADVLLPIDDRDILTNDPDNRLDNPEHPDQFILRNVSKADSDLTTYTIDSSFASSANFSFPLEIQNGVLRLNGEGERNKFGLNLVQNIINGHTESVWFYIQYREEDRDVSIKRFNPKGIRLHLRYFKVDNNGL